MKDTTDRELLDAIKGGDHGAFEVLFNKYWEYLFGIIFSKLNDRAQTEDIVQDIFIYIWNSRATLNIVNGMEPYLFSAAKNQVYTLFRRSKLRTSKEEQYDYPTSAGQADELLLFREVDKLVNQELDRMPENVRRCYTLSRKDGMSIREIAKELMLSEKTVSNNLSDALKRLRIHLGSYSAETLSAILVTEIILHKI